METNNAEKKKIVPRMIYLNPDDLALIRQASEFVGLGLSPFVRTSALQNAKMILAEQNEGTE